ncbi:hypothetical protein RQP53_14510 [Paucibacter sp. APW11]|uniref:Glutaredoxin domain-containing protein n=1 Tax=Roseateles aquae TaxID=3077235 RepID=A0ABU3PD05_9BURK|nr:hypothetical protein [Paucibacter sp. APW11]MDT9000482.1 hypothetical protein [Paucibacter sp. APW11]
MDESLSKPGRWRQLLPLGILVVALSGAVAGLGHWRGAQAAERLRAAHLQPADLLMLSSADCAVCLRARRWLDAERVPYSECDIGKEPNCEALFRRLQAVGTPTFVLRGQVLSGWDASRLAAMLDG